MDDFNNFRFNPRHYEDHLSVFGRKVLTFLVQKWRSDEHRVHRSQHGHNQPGAHSATNKRVLTFRGNERNVSTPPIIFEHINTSSAGNQHDTPFDFEFSEQKNTSITSNDTIHTRLRLVQTIEAPQRTEDSTITYKDAEDCNMSSYIEAPLRTEDSTITYKDAEDCNMSSYIEAPLRTEDSTITYKDAEDCNMSSYIEAPLRAEDSTITYKNAEDCNMSSYNLINPVIERHVPTYLFEKNNYNFIVGQTKTKINEANKGNADVDWDNMFDTELLTISEAQRVLNEIESTTSNKFNIRFHNDNNKPGNTNKPHKKPQTTDKKKIKSKNQPITDLVSKKVKKVSAEPKNNFRKHKYTKAVKNWLTNVDPNHPVEDRDGELQTHAAAVQVESVVEKVKQKPNKKVIQAQLANRDGIMKFRKPKTKSFENTPEQAASSSGEITQNGEAQEQLPSSSLENKTVANDCEEKTLKENKFEKAPSKDSKKAKSKFVAPIKSQIPVRDIEFDITTVEGSNVTHCIDTLMSADSQELVTVLIYRNGFCQLNKHHAEDKCEPEGFLLNMGDVFYLFKQDQSIDKDAFQAVLARHTLVCYDGKSWLLYAKDKYHLDIHQIQVIDAEIAGSILEADSPPGNFSSLQKLVSFSPQYTVATACARQRAAWYCLQLRAVSAGLRRQLQQEQLENVFYNIEMKLLPIIAEMEELGVSVDMAKLQAMEAVLVRRMQAVEAACHRAAGRSFQVSSPAQVRALLYDELRLDARCRLRVRATPAHGAKSTSETMLRALGSEHALPRLVLEYRRLHKAHATFLAGIAHHATGGLVRPTWLQAAAATGRIACNNPNLQAIPKAPFSLALFPEHAAPEDIEEGALNLRSVYVARAGCVVLACDFRHVECRVWAHLAADAGLRAALRAPGDFFHLLADKWLGASRGMGGVGAVDRERTKRIVYAALYGAGARKLADMLDVGYEHALSLLASFNRTFPSLKSWGEGVVRACSEARGRLATPAGRVRRVPGVASPQPALRERAQRQAVNFLIQGSAADVCKLAMVQAVSALRAAGLRARLLLQVHDELVWELHEPHLHHAAQVIQQAMEQCGQGAGLPPLPVALAAGRSWGELQPYQLST